jgi:hypothetical protein
MTNDGGFLVRMGMFSRRWKVWTGSSWADCPEEPTDDQCLAVGGVRVTVAEAERVSTLDAGERITMIPNHEGN